MFTGIIEEVGVVAALTPGAEGARLSVGAREVLGDLAVGASIAVNGVCLTAVELTGESFSADLSPETLERTNLGALGAGSRVNLERPLAPGDRLSGHFVQGHVDAAGELLVLDPLPDENWWLKVRFPAELSRYFVFKGSIAVDGVSLTIASLEEDVIGVAVIPHTYQETAFRDRRPGDRVNIECDMIAKHVERLLSQMELPRRSPLDIDDLKQQGY